MGVYRVVAATATLSLISAEREEERLRSTLSGSMGNGSPQTRTAMDSIQLSDKHDLNTIEVSGSAAKNVSQACFQFFFGKVTHNWIIVHRTIRRESTAPRHLL